MKHRQRKTDFGLLLLRLTVGGLLAGHGAQKLFGWFEGPGPEGSAQYTESLGLEPGQFWGRAAGLSEFGGGLLTTLGLLNPLGPLSIAGSMLMASATQHRDKPIWATEGGAELPVTNLAASLALMLAGPGRYSLDRLFGIRLPAVWVALLTAFGGAVLVQGLRGSLEVEPESPAAGQAQPAQAASPPAS
jgi:putative oxidoreductase